MSKLTAPQKRFADRLPTFEEGEKLYVEIPIKYRDYRVAFRAVEKLGLHGSYSGGCFTIWAHKEDTVDRLVRSEYNFLTSRMSYPVSHPRNIEAQEIYAWLRAKFGFKVLKV